MIHFIVPAAHARGIQEYLELWGKDLAGRLRVIHSESLPTLTRAAPGTYVLAALDQHPPAMAAYMEAFHSALSNRPGVRLLNDPRRTLQRFPLLRELHARGRNAFRAVRVDDDLGRLTYPVFVRDERNHDGALSPLLCSPAEVAAVVGRLIVQGHAVRDLMVVEFCDTADADGYYRKYAAFVVGDHVVPRSLSYSRSWMLKFGDSDFSERLAQEEHDYVLQNPHEAELRELFALARVEYGRVDYALKDGRLQTWEINLNPTIGRGLRPSTGKIPPQLAAIRVPTKEHFYRRFRDAWEHVDLEVPAGPAIELGIDKRVTSAALNGAKHDGRWLAQVRRVLRPVKPIIEPVVRRALPVLGRAMMRRPRR